MDTAEMGREIRRSVDTGKVVFGYREAEKNVLKGNGELIILSSNAPTDAREKTGYWSATFGIPVFAYPGKSLELGSVCGKPFSVSTILVLDAGKSKVLEISLPSASKKTIIKSRA